MATEKKPKRYFLSGTSVVVSFNYFLMDNGILFSDSFLIGGSTNGMLSVWDLSTGALLSSKQLYGRITGIK
jgi:hypothetical protein